MILMDHDKHTRTEKAAIPAEEKLPEMLNDRGKPGAMGEKGEAPDERAQSEVEQAFLELSDRLLRLTAEFDNYKKRTAKEKDALALQSEARIMLRLLPIYEEIGLAEKEVAKVPDKPTRDGAMMVLGKLKKSFESEGLAPMKLDGEKLDPFRHEVAMREDSDAPEGAIVRVIKQGYLYKGAVLQHAIVSVSSGKKAEGKPEQRDGKNSEVEA